MFLRLEMNLVEVFFEVVCLWYLKLECQVNFAMLPKAGWDTENVPNGYMKKLLSISVSVGL